MVGIEAAVAMLSAGLAIVPTTMQQASSNFMEDGDGGDTSLLSNKNSQTNVVALPAVVIHHNNIRLPRNVEISAVLLPQSYFSYPLKPRE